MTLYKLGRRLAAILVGWFFFMLGLFIQTLILGHPLGRYTTKKHTEIYNAMLNLYITEVNRDNTTR